MDKLDVSAAWKAFAACYSGGFEKGMEACEHDVRKAGHQGAADIIAKRRQEFECSKPEYD